MEDLKKYAPEFKHVNDSVAFVVHLSFLAQKCKLVGLRDEQYLEDIGSIPQGWNKSHEIYTFRYIANKAAPQKANGKAEADEEKKAADNERNTILVKIIAMEQNELLITAVRQGSDDVLTLELSIKDHIDVEKCKDLSNYAAIFRDIDGLHILLNDQITHKVIPQPQAKKEEAKENAQNKKKQKKANDPNPLIYPEPNPNPLLIGGGRGGIPFGGGYGDRDLDPFGGGGGNLMGPNQIGQQWRNQNNPNANRPPFVPPNARFDPFGPGGGGPGPDHFKPPDQGHGFGGGGFGGGFGNGFM